MICLNKFMAVLGMTLVLVAAVFTFSCDAAETVIISFEQSEGFPVPGGNFTDKEIPKDIVTVWTNDSTTANTWFIDDGPGGVSYPEAPVPVSGKQIAGFGAGGNGINIGTMHLNKKANLVLTSFYWAYRGNGDSRPGGNAYLELEYFDINEKSLGKEKFQGGLAPDWSPKFELARTSTQFQDVPLSKVIFRGVPSDPAAGHGTFFLDDVTLSLPGKKDISEPRVSKFRQVDTTPPMVKLPQPPPDSTVRGNPIISVKFSDVGSGINVSSAKLLLDGNDVTAQAKVTAEDTTLNFAKPLEKGVHRVEVTVSDNAGSQSNRQSWRFGVDVPVVVKAEFKEGVFMVSDEPYFPMGIYNGNCDPTNPEVSKSPYLAQAAASGINFQNISESLGLDNLDSLLNLGMKAMKAVSASLPVISEENKYPLTSLTVGIKDHPAFLGWWASDPDIMEKARNNMSLGYKILKENDPNHPVIWLLSHRDKYKESIKSADACFVYMYPILVSNQTVKSIYDVTLKTAFEAANPEGKPVWYASQAIDMRIANGEKLSSPDDFRPTPEEMRAMNYLALAKGVKGLFLYAQGSSPTPGVYNDLTEYPAQWKEAMKIASEVRYLSTVLAAGKPTQTARIEPENAAIHYGEIEHEGMKTLIAVNVADTPFTVTWRFPNLVQPVVLFEDRMLSEKANEITDIFKPLEVHVYRWK